MHQIRIFDNKISKRTLKTNTVKMSNDTILQPTNVESQMTMKHYKHNTESIIVI
jgi:hypothetical protein